LLPSPHDAHADAVAGEAPGGVDDEPADQGVIRLHHQAVGDLARVEHDLHHRRHAGCGLHGARLRVAPDVDLVVDHRRQVRGEVDHVQVRAAARDVEVDLVHDAGARVRVEDRLAE
jgi:hypothetical protein